MKKFKLFLITIALLAISASMNTSCEPVDDACANGKGTLNLENTSISTVQRIMINGVNYGTLDPGEEKDIELSPGEYVFQQIGLSGGSGCSPAFVTITACDWQGFTCKGK
jgi:hypothetical protein